ncbi:hypothetical protein GJ496_007874 [Pomphorhynchus laevis]|nr:hypothetical protein GJ496_007874 [Pomphorhynchus laevis]
MMNEQIRAHTIVKLSKCKRTEWLPPAYNRNCVNGGQRARSPDVSPAAHEQQIDTVECVDKGQYLRTTESAERSLPHVHGDSNPSMSVSTGVLSPDSIIDGRTVESVLNDFHPMPSEINEDVLLSKRFHRAAYHHEVRFRAIDDECIIRASHVLQSIFVQKRTSSLNNPKNDTHRAFSLKMQEGNMRAAINMLQGVESDQSVLKLDDVRSNNPRSDKGYAHGWIRRFIKLMSSEDTSAATRLITASVNSGRVLRLDDRVGEQTVRQRLGDLHPNASDIHEEFCLADHLPNATHHHPITFQDINNEDIINAARRTQGYADCAASIRKENMLLVESRTKSVQDRCEVAGIHLQFVTCKGVST